MGGIKAPQDLFLRKIKALKCLSFVLFLISLAEAFLIWSKP